MKNTKEFLTENKETVITYYNDNVKDYYNVTLKSFMNDLMNNFRKITICEELKKFDLTGNLSEAKSRLGMMDIKITTEYTTSYSESNHAKRVHYYGKESQVVNL